MPSLTVTIGRNLGRGMREMSDGNNPEALSMKNEYLHRRLTVALLGLFILVSCSEYREAKAPQNSSADWLGSAAHAAGFDLAELDRLTRDIESGEFPNTHALLIEHRGALIYEKYWSGTDARWGEPLGERDIGPESLHDLRSVSKSVTSLVLGIALAGDVEAAVLEPIDTFLPEGSRVPGRSNITLHHVLTMTMGLEWNEMTVPYTDSTNDEIRLYNEQDPVLYVMSRPVVDEPGQSWYYSGGTTQVLGSVVLELTGQPLDEFARAKLFEPLGITEFEWLGRGIWTPDNPAAASGLRLTARDLAKIGSLMLHGGRWQGRQIVPEAWVRLSGTRHVAENGPWSNGGIWGYGYQWWVGDLPQGVRVIAGWGNGNQRLFIMPGEGLVVTILAGQYDRFEGHSERLLNRVLEAR